MLKKSILIMALACFSLSAYSATRDDWSSEFGIVLGPKLNVKNSTNQFTIGIMGGGKYLKYGISYARFSITGVKVNAFRPYMGIEIPFGFDIASESELLIGPMFDLGPAFAFGGGQKMIDVMQIGYGMFVKFYFSETFGVGMTPVHFTNSFATYTTGGIGLQKQTTMTYDLLFSFLMRW